MARKLSEGRKAARIKWPGEPFVRKRTEAENGPQKTFWPTKTLDPCGDSSMMFIPKRNGVIQMKNQVFVEYYLNRTLGRAWIDVYSRIMGEDVYAGLSDCQWIIPGVLTFDSFR